jgi:hypothetical protein
LKSAESKRRTETDDLYRRAENWHRRACLLAPQNFRKNRTRARSVLFNNLASVLISAGGKITVDTKSNAESQFDRPSWRLYFALKRSLTACSCP